MAPLSSLTKKPVKAIILGESSSGKTGALCSLAAAGYKLHIADIDKGADIIASLLLNPNGPYFKKNPKAAENVDVISISDSMKPINGILMPVKAEGWIKLTKLLNDWRDEETSFGPISSWTSNDVLVIDSLTGLAKLAMHFHLQMQGALGRERTQNEWRRDIGGTQNRLRDLLDLLYDDKILCNVIMISHITTVSDAGGSPKVEEGEWKGIPTGYPSAIGRSLSPHIPRWFNNMWIVNREVQGNKSSHKIFTSAKFLDGQNVSAKSSAPLSVKPSYDIEWGLAELFEDLKK